MGNFDIKVLKAPETEYCTACSVVNYEGYEGTVIDIYMNGLMLQLCGACADIMVKKIHALKGEEA